MLRNILNRTVGCGQRVSKFNGSEQRWIHWEARDADQSVKKKTAVDRVSNLSAFTFRTRQQQASAWLVFTRTCGGRPGQLIGPDSKCKHVSWSPVHSIVLKCACVFLHSAHAQMWPVLHVTTHRCPPLETERPHRMALYGLC